MRILKMTETNKKRILKDVAAQLESLTVIPDKLSLDLSTSKKVTNGFIIKNLELILIKSKTK